MVHCRTNIPYPSSSHPIEGDYLGRGSGDYDAPRSHTIKWRDINKIGACVVPAVKYDNAVARYGKYEGGDMSMGGVPRDAQKVITRMNVPHWEITW
jgi:hypothetical protein